VSGAVDQGLTAYAIAFGAGVLSFLSPCVLPLIPAYISFITGIAPGELEKGTAGWRDVLVPSLMFVAGFSVIFVALGASASALGSVLVQYRITLSRVAGGVIFVLGFFMLGVVRIPWLYGEARFDMAATRRFGAAAAVVMGMAFAFGWTPCVGPILASILLLAGSSRSLVRGALLLGTYSLGLGLPFVMTGLLFGRMKGALGWLNRNSRAINLVAGSLLMVMGLLIAFGLLPALTGQIAKAVPFLNLG
jgi:cytochrome c-type biogenesis protein